MKNKWRIFKLGFIGLNMIGMLIMMYSVSIYSHHRTTCIMDALGKPCWGCNTIAALKAIMRGQWIEAFQLNWRIFLWLLAFVSLLTNEIYHRLKDWTNKQSSLSWIDKLIRGMFKGMPF